jgi:hypothetical protein
VKPEDLHDLLARCSVRISSDGRHVGTGFFLAPGKVLTAAHVVAPSILAHKARPPPAPTPSPPTSRCRSTTSPPTSPTSAAEKTP